MNKDYLDKLNERPSVILRFIITALFLGFIFAGMIIGTAVMTGAF